MTSQINSTNQENQEVNRNAADLSYSCHTESSISSPVTSPIALRVTTPTSRLTLDNLPLSPIATPSSPLPLRGAVSASTPDEASDKIAQLSGDPLSTSLALAARCSPWSTANSSVSVSRHCHQPMRAVVSTSAFNSTNNNPNRHSFHAGMLVKHPCQMDLNKFPNSSYSKDAWLGNLKNACTSSKNNLNRSFTICVPNSPSRDVNPTTNNGIVIAVNNHGENVCDQLSSNACTNTSFFCRTCFRDVPDSSRLTSLDEQSSDDRPNIYIVNSTTVNPDSSNTRNCFEQYSNKSDFTDFQSNAINVIHSSSAGGVITSQMPSGAYIYNNVIYSRPVKKPTSKICEGIDHINKINSNTSDRAKPIDAEEMFSIDSLSASTLKNFQRSSTIANLNNDHLSVSKENTVSGSSLRSGSTRVSHSSLNTLMDDVSVVHKPPLPPRNRQSSTAVINSNYKVPPPPVKIQRLKSNLDSLSSNRNQNTENNSNYKVPPLPVEFRKNGTPNVNAGIIGINAGTNINNDEFFTRSQEYQVPPQPKHLRTQSHGDSIMNSDSLMTSTVPINEKANSNQVKQSKDESRRRSFSLSENSSSQRKRKLDGNALKRKSDKYLPKSFSSSENKENIPEQHSLAENIDSFHKQNPGFPTFGALNGNFAFTFKKNLSCLNSESCKDLTKQNDDSNINLKYIDDCSKDEVLTSKDNKENEVTFSQTMANYSLISNDYENISNIFPKPSDYFEADINSENNKICRSHNNGENLEPKQYSQNYRPESIYAASADTNTGRLLLQEINMNSPQPVNNYRNKICSSLQPAHRQTRGSNCGNVEATAPQPLSSSSSNSSSGSSSGRCTSLPRMGVKSVAAAAKLGSRNNVNNGNQVGVENNYASVATRREPLPHARQYDRTPLQYGYNSQQYGHNWQQYGHHSERYGRMPMADHPTRRGIAPPCPAPAPPPKVLPNPLAPLASTNILEESRFWVRASPTIMHCTRHKY